jgi:hypothetical protein
MTIDARTQYPILLQQQIQEGTHRIMQLAPRGDPACPYHLNSELSLTTLS